MDYTPFISPIVTAAIAIIGAYVAMKNANNAKFEELKVQNAEQYTMLKALKEQVEKHNSIVERTYGLEHDMKTAFVRIDELKARDDKLEEMLGK